MLLCVCVSDPAMWSGEVYNPVYKAAVGNNVYLLCDVCVNPPGTYTWLHSHTPIHYPLTGPILLLRNITKEQYGNYTCVVTNLHGQKQFPITLMADDSPPEDKTWMISGLATGSTLLFIIIILTVVIVIIIQKKGKSGYQCDMDYITYSTVQIIPLD